MPHKSCKACTLDIGCTARLLLSAQRQRDADTQSCRADGCSAERKPNAPLLGRLNKLSGIQLRPRMNACCMSTWQQLNSCSAALNTSFAGASSCLRAVCEAIIQILLSRASWYQASCVAPATAGRAVAGDDNVSCQFGGA